MQAFNWFKLQNGSDIRGVALEGIPNEPVNLTPEVVAHIGHAFVHWLMAQTDKPAAELTISVGRDSRLSGPVLLKALTTAIAACGCQVYDFGMASTPAMFMSTVTDGFRCDGAVMLTASHLPFNRNGCKFFTPQGGLGKPDIKAVLTLAEADANPVASAPGPITQRDFMAVYAKQLVATIRAAVNHPDHFNTPLQGFQIVVDAGNGAGGFYAERVLVPLGADINGSQFLEPDGTFPNHSPNPEDATAMAALRAAVVGNGADFGIIFDTDVDRSAAVDQQGTDLNRNRLIAIMAAIVLQEHPGSTIVTDSITSDGLTQFIEQDLQGVHHRFKRGYKNVINESVRLNQAGQESWLAIETSGHGAMRENYFLDDGAYLISKVLIKLAQSRLAQQSLTELIAPLKEPIASQEFRLKITIETFQAYGHNVITQLQAFAEQQPDWQVVPNNYEGVRIACPSAAEDGWFLLRLSLHDPVLPLNIESNVAGGVAKIATRLHTFFQDYGALDLAPLGSGSS